MDMLKTFKVVLEYDGSSYHGWQRQKEGKTIQGEIEAALERMTNQKVTLIGSGRTDAGAHAIGQVASFKLKTNLNSMAFHKGLNSLLANDIVIKSCESLSYNFHARFDVRYKTYRYYIMNKRIPSAIRCRFIWHIKRSLDLKTLKLAASYFVGNHDFKAFENSGSYQQYTTRTITKSFVESYSNGSVVYTVEADGFLRAMVRNIVGTLVDVGLGKVEARRIPELIESRDRSEIGATAPPHGLFLVKVDY